MEGHTILTFLHLLLQPAHWLAGQIGLPDHLPAVELGVGLVFLAACFGLALHGLYAWLRSKKILPLLAAIVGVAGGIIMVIATVTFRHLWLYTLVLAIVAADMYWRILSKNGLPKQIRRAGTVWAAAALLLCAGTPSLFLLHTWFTEHRITNALQARLAAEQTDLTGPELSHVKSALATVATSPELLDNTFATGDPLLLASIQHLAVEQSVPYLVLVDPSGKVLARSQPVAAFGDTWPVIFDLKTDSNTGLTRSERGTPILLASHSVQTKTGAVTLVGGIFIDQTYLSNRSSTIHAPLFTLTEHGITALAAPEGKAVNALSATNVDTFVAARAGKAGSFSIASDGQRYLVATAPLIGIDNQVVGTLGTAELDSSTDFRLRLDLIVMIALAIFVLALPALAWRRKEGM